MEAAEVSMVTVSTEAAMGVIGGTISAASMQASM